MSKLFSDPEYKAMSESDEGWLELAIEPFRFPLNEDIAQLPERTEFNYDFMLKEMSTNYDHIYYRNSVDISEFVADLFKKTHKRELTTSELVIVTGQFALEIEDGTILDLDAGELSSPIVLIKKQERLKEEEVIAEVTKVAMEIFRNIRRCKSGSHSHGHMVSRMNEIMDLIGVSEERKSRSLWRKDNSIRVGMRKILIEDKWKIRDSNLIMDICTWVVDYINNGNAHSLMNFTRLKCMTHKGNPIYSLEEMV